MSPSATRAAARRSDTKPNKSRRFPPSISLGNLADIDSAKVLLTAVMTVIILGYAGYAAYRFTQGPTTKIVDGID